MAQPVSPSIIEFSDLSAASRELGLEPPPDGKTSIELAILPGEYAPPQGCILLAARAEEYIGCVALRPLEDRICEMKRLYVIPGFRGQKIGRALVRGIIDEARLGGYEHMRLDTIATMTAAKSLYLSLGFRSIKPYRYNPLDNPTYFELDLRQ